MQNILSFSGIENSEETIRKTWEEFRQQLADQVFLYSDIDAALQSTFLSVFDDLFQHGHSFLEKRVDNVLNADCDIVRAARIDAEAPPPDYDRFIPKAEFINEDNRFSPRQIN